MEVYKVLNVSSLFSIICLLVAQISKEFSMNSFYVTLPSNTNVTSNKTGDFIVRLPEKLNFSGNWEVALVEFTYPYSWNNVGLYQDDDTEVTIYSIDYRSKDLHFNISQGQYDTIDELINNINVSYTKFAKLTEQKELKAEKDVKDLIKTLNEDDHRKEGAKKWLNNKERLVKKKLEGAFKVTYDNLLKKVKIYINSSIIAGVVLSDQLAYIMGFFTSEELARPGKKALSGSNEIIAKMPVDLNAGIDTMYIYCNIVQAQIVGDIRAQLLRTVKVDGKYGDTVNKVFNTPHYIPLNEKEFDTIQLNVKTDTNKTMPFQYGKVLAKLHFRRQNIFNI